MQGLGADLNDIAGNELRASRQARLRNRIQLLVVFAGLSAYTVFFYRELLFTDHVYVFRDMYTMWFAFEHTARTIARWHWPPLWDPFTALGRPFAADLVAGVYYPLNWVLRQLSEARGFNISIAVHHFIAAAGVFVLLRYRRLSVLPAALGAVAFGFGGMMVSLDNLINGLQSAAWLPWVLLTFDIWCTRRTTTAPVAIALALAMSVLGAMPEFTVFANALAVAIAVDRSRSGSGPGIVKSLSALLAGNLLAFGLCAVQLVPFVEYVMHSSRMTGLRAGSVTVYSLQPLGALAFLIPRHYVDPSGQFHETAALWEGNLAAAPWVLTLYMGVLLVLLVPALASLSRFRRRWWGGIGLVFLTLALGEHLPGYLWLVQHVSLLRMVRYPEKFLLVVHGLLAVGAAVGLERILCEPARARTVALAAALLAAVALMAHPITVGAATLPAVLLSADFRFLALLFALVAAFAVAARTHPRMAGVAFLLLVAADLYRINGQLLPTVPWTAVQRRPRTLDVMERGEDPLRIYSDALGRAAVPPFPDDFIQEQNLLLMHDASYYLIGNLNAPTTVMLSDHEAMEEMIEGSPRERTGTVLGMFNVAYVTSPKDLRRPGLRMVQSPRDALEAYVFAVEPHAARAFAPARLHATRTREQAIDYLMHQADLSEVTLMAESVPAGLGAEMDGTVRIVSYLPERLELLAQMRTAGLVVLADTYYPGWQATIDGVPTAIVRANYFARGVYVTAGEHDIVFRYAPLSFRTGAVVSGLTCGALVLCLAWTRRR